MLPSWRSLRVCAALRLPSHSPLCSWALALGHLAAALVQAATIVGIGTALTQLQLATFAL